MEKIEERLLCKHCLTDETRFCHTDCHFYSRYQGAKEQKVLDIDKACEWIEDNAINYIGDFGITDWGALRTDFRKAMEE